MYSSPLLIHGFAFYGFSYSHQEANNPPSQDEKSSLRLQHNAYSIHLTSLYHMGILSSHIIRRKMSTVH